MPAFKEVLYPAVCGHRLCLDSLGPACYGAQLVGSVKGRTLSSQGQTVRKQDNMGTFHDKPLLLGHPVPTTLKGQLRLLLMTCSRVWACLGLASPKQALPLTLGYSTSSQLFPKATCMQFWSLKSGTVLPILLLPPTKVGPQIHVLHLPPHYSLVEAHLTPSSLLTF